MYDYYLRGMADGAIDQDAAQEILRVLPEVVDAASANHGFLLRAVKRMATEWGIRQFIDIGSVTPTQRNVHDVVADTVPDGRVIYVDNDPMLVTRGRDLLAGVTGTAMFEGDVRELEAVVGHPETRRLIDLAAPVGLLMTPALTYVSDDEDPWGLVGRWCDRIAPGSYLAISHGSGDFLSEQVRDAVLEIYAAADRPPVDRTRTEIERFFKDLEIVPPYPGADPVVTFAGVWGAEDPVAAENDDSRVVYVAVARRP
jgi:hypothetical protein